MNVNNWEKEEQDFLVKEHLNFSIKELSEKLDRSMESVRSKLRRLGIKRSTESVTINRFNIKPKIGRNKKIPKSKIKSISREIKKEPVRNETPKRRPKQYQTLIRDFTKMVPVYIDHKTTIYISSEQNPKKEKQKYIERMEKKVIY